MTRYLPLLFLAGIAAEIASIIWVGRAIGVFPTLLLLLAGGIAGVSLIKGAGASLMDTLRSPVQGPSVERRLAGETLARALSGLLFLIPGFLSDAAGLLLLLPPVRRWLRNRLKVERFTATPQQERRFDTVIEGEVIDVTAEIERPGPPERER